jgi:ATP-dependent RNA helicase SrmB
MHGDFNQAIRRDKTRKFRIGQIKVMVATDVAARGLDLSNISHVINYDLPFRGDVYIHRIGRTGRAQKIGNAINLVAHHDRKNLERIEYHLEGKLPVGKFKGLESKSAKKEAKKHKNVGKKRYIAKKDRGVADVVEGK